jgi:hypothetical protein
MFLKKLGEKIKLASRNTKKRINKKQLRRDLDNITTSVANRGVYFYRKNTNDYYDIYSYFDKRAILKDVPFIRLTKSITKRLNSKDQNKTIKTDTLQTDIERFHKHYNDSLFYNYTLRTATTNFQRQVVLSRMDMTVMYLKELREHLLNY